MRSPSAQPSMAMPAAPLSLPHCHAHIAPGALGVSRTPSARQVTD
jgi:hypothetical protein